jgi:hypothetical protein
MCLLNGIQKLTSYFFGITLRAYISQNFNSCFSFIAEDESTAV